MHAQEQEEEEEYYFAPFLPISCVVQKANRTYYANRSTKGKKKRMHDVHICEENERSGAVRYDVRTCMQLYIYIYMFIQT